MITPLLNELIEKAETLPPDEQLQLITRLQQRAFQRMVSNQPTRRKWREIRGMAKPSLFGEDAQTWINRTRREGDERRERLLRGAP
jgi:hypothetical protein